MKPYEAELILLGAYFETVNSRADYFRIKGLEGNYNPITYCNDLFDAYSRIEKYVNQFEYDHWGLDEAGKRVFDKKAIQLHRYNDNWTGLVTCDNIIELLSPLHQFAQSIIQAVKGLEKSRPEGRQSFTWTGTQAQLQALWRALKDAGCIHHETTKEAFTAIFAPVLKQCEPVKWTESNKLLSYFFNQMNSGDNPLILSKEWQSTIGKYKIFKTKKGKVLTAGDLSTALNSINDIYKGLQPKGHEKIDDILKNIKTLRP